MPSVRIESFAVTMVQCSTSAAPDHREIVLLCWPDSFVAKLQWPTLSMPGFSQTAENGAQVEINDGTSLKTNALLHERGHRNGYPPQYVAWVVQRDSNPLFVRHDYDTVSLAPVRPHGPDCCRVLEPRVVEAAWTATTKP